MNTQASNKRPRSDIHLFKPLNIKQKVWETSVSFGTKDSDQIVPNLTNGTKIMVDTSEELSDHNLSISFNKQPKENLFSDSIVEDFVPLFSSTPKKRKFYWIND